MRGELPPYLEYVDTTREKAQASQRVRLFADGALAVYLVYLGLSGKIRPVDRFALSVFAIGTILYNGRNYLERMKDGGKND